MALSDSGSYALSIAPRALKAIEQLPTPKVRQQVAERIEALRVNPRPPGCEKLSGYRNLYRLRQGIYRVVYEIIDDELRVLVVRVATRSNVYR